MTNFVGLFSLRNYNCENELKQKPNNSKENARCIRYIHFSGIKLFEVMIWTYEVNIFAIDETIIKNGLEEILHADLDWKKKGDCVLRVCVRAYWLCIRQWAFPTRQPIIKRLKLLPRFHSFAHQTDTPFQVKSSHSTLANAVLWQSRVHFTNIIVW